MTTYRQLACASILSLILCSACGGPQTDSKQDYVGNENPVRVGDSHEDDDSGVTAPTTTTPANGTQQRHKEVNVYVENSGSMYGYVGVGQGSDFRNMVYNYLTDVKIAGIFDGMNLYFINSEVIREGSAVDDFVKKLAPNTFKVAGGNAGATDIVEIIKKVYPSDGKVSVLVSDCIISPGRRHNASEYLVNQQIGIKGFLAQRPNLSQTGVIIYRMLGRFKGNYYDTVDNKRLYVGIRPYYVWVMGDVAALKELRKNTEPKMKTQPDELCVITSENPGFKYYVLPGGGKYRLSRTAPQTTIEKVGKVKTSEGSRVVVKLNADYSQMLQDEAYLTDVVNYEVSDPMYRIDNVSKVSDERYVITISCAVVKKGTIYIRLKNKPPQWVSACSDTDGGFPNPKDSIQTTYGLSYLIGGVFDAYTNKCDNLAEMKITIK